MYKKIKSIKIRTSKASCFFPLQFQLFLKVFVKESLEHALQKKQILKKEKKKKKERNIKDRSFYRMHIGRYNLFRFSFDAGAMSCTNQEWHEAGSKFWGSYRCGRFLSRIREISEVCARHHGISTAKSHSVVRAGRIIYRTLRTLLQISFHVVIDLLGCCDVATNSKITVQHDYHHFMDSALHASGFIIGKGMEQPPGRCGENTSVTNVGALLVWDYWSTVQSLRGNSRAGRDRLWAVARRSFSPLRRDVYKTVAVAP